jgi:hypothetical protein
MMILMMIMTMLMSGGVGGGSVGCVAGGETLVFYLLSDG